MQTRLEFEPLETRLCPALRSWALGDLTGDNRIDYVAAGAITRVYDGATCQLAETLPRASRVAITDMNGDGTDEVWLFRDARSRPAIEKAAALETATELAREQARGLGVVEVDGCRALTLFEWQTIIDTFSRIPPALRAYVAAHTAGFEVTAGDSVADLPDYAWVRGMTTWGGEPYTQIRGVAQPGLPAAVVFPREVPAPNTLSEAIVRGTYPFTLLHEFGHLIDLAATPYLSSLPAWQSLNATDIYEPAADAREYWADNFADWVLGRSNNLEIAAYFSGLPNRL